MKRKYLEYKNYEHKVNIEFKDENYIISSRGIYYVNQDKTILLKETKNYELKHFINEYIVDYFE